MCIFTQSVEHVAGTKIFARREGDEQLLVYEMSFAAAGDLAMVLPLPVAPGRGERGLRFIDLSGLFGSPFPTLEGLFPEPLSAAAGEVALGAQASTLAVQRVGDFDASFVPTMADFERLDARFRLSAEVWQALPQYADFGFAVFKLHGEERGLWDRLFGRWKVRTEKVHPMGLAFVSRHPERLFFPTLHVHDGAVHAEALYDHDLYCQLPHDPPHQDFASPLWWQRARKGLTEHDAERSRGVLHARDAVFRLALGGRRRNRDVYAEVAPLPAPRPDPDPGSTTFRIARVEVSGALSDWSTAIGRMLQPREEALQRAHERHVAGILGDTWLWLDVNDQGRVEAIAIQSAHAAPALADELRAALADFEIPDMGTPRYGRIFLSCGFGKQPRNPMAF